MPLAYLLFHQIVHRPDQRDGLITVERQQLLAHGLGELERIPLGPYRERGERRSILRKGNVNALRPPAVFEGFMHVRGDSDNERRSLVHAADQQALTDGIETVWKSRPKAASQCLVDNGHTLCIQRISLGKVPPAPQRNP